MTSHKTYHVLKQQAKIENQTNVKLEIYPYQNMPKGEARK